MQINFTGKNQLTNDEFIDFYDELWKRTPHYTINWPSNDEISRMKTDGSKIYNSDAVKLEDEDWEFFPNNADYKISSLGRVKYKEQLIIQDDKYNNRPGYLVLTSESVVGKINRTREVYTFVAMTFMGKVEGDGLHVHHIDNNGYNCSTSNLILLTERQHKAVHLDEHLTKIELVHFLDNLYCEERIKNHLANYKLNNLDIIECGIWKQNGKKYSHILPDDQKLKNLIDVSFKTEFHTLYKKKETCIHKYFAHLSSSQALCFNLFYPLVLSHHLDVIDSSITESAEADFEYIEQNSFEVNNNNEKTNFDFFINDAGKKSFFEVKYTEQNFGSVYETQINDRHDKKYHAYYKKQIKKIANQEISEKEFFDNYQIWRNICHSDIGRVYFVFLKNREDLRNEVENVITKCKSTYKEKIRILYIEDIVKNSLKIRDNKINTHYKEFYEKYLKGI